MNKTKLITFLAVMAGIGLLGKFYAQSTPSSKTNTSDQIVNVVLPETRGDVSTLDTGAPRVTIPELPSKQELKPVKRLTLKPENVVLVLDEIDESALSIADEIMRKERDGAKELYVLINSPGGSVLDGAMIISAMEAVKIPVYTVCLQLCASMGAMIHSYGKERYAVDRAILMYHPASGGLSGSVPQMSARLKWISEYVLKMDAFIAKRSKISLDEFLRKIESELWLDAEDATRANFNDRIVSVDLKLEKDKLAILQGVSKKMKKELINLTR